MHCRWLKNIKNSETRREVLVTRHQSSPGFFGFFNYYYFQCGGTRQPCWGRWMGWGWRASWQRLGRVVSFNVMWPLGLRDHVWDIRSVTHQSRQTFSKILWHPLSRTALKQESLTKKWCNVCVRREFLWQAHSTVSAYWPAGRHEHVWLPWSTRGREKIRWHFPFEVIQKGKECASLPFTS